MEPVPISRDGWLAFPMGAANVDDAFRHSARNFVFVIVRRHRHGQRLKIWRLTACAIALLACAAFWLNAPLAQTNAAVFDANGNAVATLSR